MGGRTDEDRESDADDSLIGQTLASRYKIESRIGEGAMKGLHAEVHYAVKANSNQAVIRTFAKMGAGADIVSEGEMRRALAAGVPANHIVFSGVGKKPSELRAALEAGIRQINVESRYELDMLDEPGGGAAVSVGASFEAGASGEGALGDGDAGLPSSWTSLAPSSAWTSGAL